MNELMSPARSSLPALPYGELVVPLLVAQEGERAAKRYVEFFAANIRNSIDPAWVILSYAA
jgi:hypothetical protein